MLKTFPIPHGIPDGEDMGLYTSRCMRYDLRTASPDRPMKEGARNVERDAPAREKKKAKVSHRSAGDTWILGPFMAVASVMLALWPPCTVPIVGTEHLIQTAGPGSGENDSQIRGRRPPVRFPPRTQPS